MLLWPAILLILLWLGFSRSLGVLSGVGDRTESGWGINGVGDWTSLGDMVPMASGKMSQCLRAI